MRGFASGRAARNATLPRLVGFNSVVIIPKVSNVTAQLTPPAAGWWT
jgi:hypothetical protein